MCRVESEARVALVIEVEREEVRCRGVTRSAIRHRLARELTGVRVGVAILTACSGGAREAPRVRRRVAFARVTAGALGSRVRSHELESGPGRVIESAGQELVERLRRVAARAAGSAGDVARATGPVEGTSVHVDVARGAVLEGTLARMQRDAHSTRGRERRGLARGDCRGGVAGRARRARVRALEHEPGPARVVEVVGRRLESVRIVARGASRRGGLTLEEAAVGVDVARRAIVARAWKRLGDDAETAAAFVRGRARSVTRRALGARVRADELVTGPARVVELRAREHGEARRRVTGRAVVGSRLRRVVDGGSGEEAGVRVGVTG